MMRARAWRAANPELSKARSKAWHDKNRESVREGCRRWRRENRDKALRLCRESRKKWKYGVSASEARAMLEGQGFSCPICGVTLKYDDPGTHIDHDHVSGRFRGMLCGCCNPGLGYFKDSPRRLRAAADYIESRSADGSCDAVEDAA
jgi:hypothetical protein